MSEPSDTPELENNVRRQLTIAELGVIISILCSTVTGAYVAGKLSNDVQRHTERLQLLEPRVDTLSTRIERIDANVAFLTEEARDRRNGK
ncbi:hypothetical protein [Novosphingobium sp.]|uniref:hypothetical protein n=1 Tax=Novosphingobium sp. TaxID=1874826 RepID=UPI0031E0DC08